MYDLKVEGQPPSAMDAIRVRLLGQQDAAGGVDASVDFVYAVPIELAQAITGFCHDADVPGSGEHAVLRRRLWWKRLW